MLDPSKDFVSLICSNLHLKNVSPVLFMATVVILENIAVCVCKIEQVSASSILS